MRRRFVFQLNAEGPPCPAAVASIIAAIETYASRFIPVESPRTWWEPEVKKAWLLGLSRRSAKGSGRQPGANAEPKRITG